jgi:hypothetical protein
MFPFLFYKPIRRKPLLRRPVAHAGCGGSIGGPGDDLIIIGSGIPGPPGPAGPAGSLNNVPVKLVDVNYNAMQKDYYIGALEKDITIKLPLGTIGKIFVVKNQAQGNIRVESIAGETLDDAPFKVLGTEGSLMVLFDGTRWNLI